MRRFVLGSMTTDLRRGIRRLAEVDFYESPDACRYLLWNYEEYLTTTAGPSATYDETNAV